jgi:hypothetical protein
MLWRLYLYETLLERLAQHFEGIPLELRQLIQQEETVVGQRHLPGRGTWPPPMSPTAAIV